ncbi:MAG: type VI secretion system baseplate subunit TssG [Magnetospirillum sp.]|nr:type VI secretion system baseplate subunit TssG [Magnetospirillum sp.]
MAADVGRSARSLIRRLAGEPHRFALLQAVRLAEYARPEAVPLGQGIDPAREAVRLKGSLSRGFPASDVAGWQQEGDGGMPVLTSAFLSLGGAFGPLPPPVSELALERSRRGDDGIRDFLDSFNHRLLSLFVRAKRAHRPALQPGRPEDTQFAALLWALLGLRTPGLRQSLGRKPRARLHGHERALLECAGLLNQRPVSLHALERLLIHAFAVPVKGTPFVGRWLRLDPEQYTVLGRPGRNVRLGQGAVLGRRVWDQSAAIRMELGPLSLNRLLRFLPGSETHRALRTLLGYALSGSTQVELKLVVPPGQVPPMRLWTANPRRAPRLGWTSWLTTRPRGRPGEVVLDLGCPGE